MKKLGLVLGLGLLSASSLFADYQLTLIDKDGTETKQCIKSYSFSNNLESLARKNGVGFKDVYSEEETMTNKVYMGKPVYRMVTTIPTLKVSYTWTHSNYTNVPQNVDTFISARLVGRVKLGITSNNNDKYKIYYMLYVNKIGYSLGAERLKLFNGKKVILEYTKTTDETNSASNTFKSYLHYVSSSSEYEEVTTIDLEDKGVQFLKDYTYDKDTDSCIAN